MNDFHLFDASVLAWTDLSDISESLNSAPAPEARQGPDCRRLEKRVQIQHDVGLRERLSEIRRCPSVAVRFCGVCLILRFRISSLSELLSCLVGNGARPNRGNTHEGTQEKRRQLERRSEGEEVTKSNIPPHFRRM